MLKHNFGEDEENMWTDPVTYWKISVMVDMLVDELKTDREWDEEFE